MSFKIEKTTPFQYRIIGDKGNLVGLITSTEGNDNWRVELMMKIDQRQYSAKEAFAFVRGAEAAMRAYKIIPSGEEKKGFTANSHLNGEG